MQLYHSQQRADRRRRVVAEDRTDDGLEPTKSGSAARASRKATAAYTDGAKQEHARRVTDLAPRTHLSLALIFLAGATSITGLVAGYLYLPEMAAWGSKDGFAALELGARGSLASWLSSVLLGFSAVAALIVWSVRRHKLDDYRGHYRWWLIAAAAWLLMSVDATTGIHDALRVVMTKLSSNAGPLAGHAWWIGLWGLILVTTVARLLLDMRACRSALVVTMLSMGLWIAALVLRFAGLNLTEIRLTLAVETSKMGGHLLLLLGSLLYARHVILHSQGLLPARGANPKKERAKKESAKSNGGESGHSTRVDGAHATPAPHSNDKRHDLQPVATNADAAHLHSAAKSSRAVEPSDEEDGDDQDQDDDDRGGRKSSKADRKRLRKQKLEDRDW